LYIFNKYALLLDKYARMVYIALRRVKRREALPASVTGKDGKGTGLTIVLASGKDCIIMK
jgi:hypothetical protein